MTGPQALLPTLFAPSRPCLPRAQTLAELHAKPDKLYREALSEGLITPEPARCFAARCARCGGRARGPLACDRCEGRGWTAEPVPAMVDHAVAVVSLGEGLAAAEGAAVACVRALQPFGAPVPERLVLRVCRSLAPGPELLGVGLAAELLEGALAALPDPSAVNAGDLAAAAVLGELPPTPVTLRHQLANDCYLAALWDLASAQGWTIPQTLEDPADCLLLSEAVRGVPFASLASPFAALLAVWSQGLVLTDLGADALVLALPAV